VHERRDCHGRAGQGEGPIARARPRSESSADLRRGVSASVLAMNLVVLANLTAVTRARHDEVVNPEDHRLAASS
jgi:hypothetical protein